jgi:endoglucanase
MNRRAVVKYVGFSALAAAIAEKSGLAGGQNSSGGVAGSNAAMLNQVGYLPRAEKIATVVAPEGGTSHFEIFAEGLKGRDQKPVFSGVLGTPMLDEASGDRVALADFSKWTKPGAYRLVTQGGMNRSGQTFSMGRDVYREALRLSMRAFYGQRCGCAVDLGGGYAHPACHGAGAYHATSGRSGPVVNHGGWHDAGDYGRYVVNSGLSTGTLLWAWELYPNSLHKLSLAIPESGGKIPDYLSEVRWNLEWMLSLQDDDGGVWHKQTSVRFCAFVMPQQDQLTSYIIGTGESPYKSTCATADLAAVMAIAARCYGNYDSAFAARSLAAARRGWSWAVAHRDVPFTNPTGISTGGYGDRHCNDEILWASAELWRTTGDKEYEQAFLAGVDALPPETSIDTPGWGSLAPMAYWTYALAERKKSDALKERILKCTASAAQVLVERRALSGYGNTLALSQYNWGSNSVAANQSLLLLMAHHFAANPAAVEAALGNLHYLLGRNCFGVSWVTHVGINPFQHPHHRPSAADGIAAPWPGLLSGGPNARPGDQVARTLPKSPPMRMWIDDQRAYSMNEIAINWNAPLVFLLAAANAQGA